MSLITFATPTEAKQYAELLARVALHNLTRCVYGPKPSSLQ